MAKALEWYANENNYVKFVTYENGQEFQVYNYDIIADKGERAREALLLGIIP